MIARRDRQSNEIQSSQTLKDSGLEEVQVCDGCIWLFIISSKMVCVVQTQGNSQLSGNTFALISISPRLPLWPPMVNELAPWPLPCALLPLVAYLCTEGSTMKHSSSAFTNPSIDSYLYQLKRTFCPMLARSRQIGGSLITILKHISLIFFMKSFI